MTIKDTSEKQREVIFGMHAIKESMAALYQSLVDEKASDSHYDYPYNSVIYIVKHLFPTLVNDIRKLICICQIALDSPSPARDLLKWLLYASENLEKNGIEIYELHLNETYFAYDNYDNKKLHKLTVQELLNQSINKYQSKLNKILLHKNKNYAGVLNTIKPFTDIHLRILYSDNDIISNMKMVMQVCGVPFIYNDYGERIHLFQPNKLNKSLVDDDILFILSLCNLSTSLILPNYNCSCRCIFRTMFCNHQLSQTELDKHIYCFDQPWRENGCNYWNILNMIGVKHSKIKLRSEMLD